MSMYFIDLKFPDVVVPCTFVASVIPGKTLLVREDGSSMVVEPDGSQSRWVPAGDPNFDSPWTQGTPLSGFLVFRSSGGPTLPGVPRAFRMIQ